MRPGEDEGAAHLQRLLLVVTGSLSAALLPHLAIWLRAERPLTATRTVVTRSARQFVTPSALAAATGGPVHLDAWHSDDPGVPPAHHVEMAEWAEAALVWPATWHYTARLALGLADSPSLLTLHTLAAPVLVAPSVPPGSLDSPVFLQHLTALRSRSGVSVAPMLVGTSAETGRAGALVPPPLPDLVRALESQLVPNAMPAHSGNPL